MARVTTLIYKATERKPRSTGSGVPTPGTSVLAPQLLANNQTFYPPSLVQDGVLELPLVENSQAFYGPIVSAAAAFVSPPKLANTQVFFAPTVNQTIQLPLVTNTQQFFAPQVINDLFVALPLVTNSQTFYGPQINQRLDAPLATNAQTFYGSTLLQGSYLVPPLVANDQAFYGPTLNQKINAPLLTNTQTFYSATIVAGQVLRAPFWANGQAFYPPQVNQSVGSGWVNNTQTFFSPIVSVNTILALPLVSNSQTFYGPAVGMKAVLPLVTNTSTVFAPVVLPNLAQSVAPPLVTNSQTFYGPKLNQSLRAPLFTNTNLIRPPSVSVASTPGFALSTPVVTLTTAAGAIPEVDITMGADIYAGFYLRIQRSATGSKNVSDGSYASPTLNIAHQITADEIHEDVLAITSANLASDGYANPSGTYFQQYRWEREDGAISNWSNEITDTVTVASTTLYTATGFNKKQYVSVTGDPALVATGTSGVGAPQPVRCTAAKTGKKQLEVTVTTLADNYVFICIEDGTTDLNSGFVAPGINNPAGFGMRISSSGFQLFKAGVSVGSGSTAGASGDVLTATFDTSAGTASFYRTRSGSTVLLGTITGISQATYQACIGPYSGSVLAANFGQSAFARALDTGYAMYG